MLALALAPTVSHALNAQKASNPWTEVCSASAPGAAGTPAQPGSGSAMHLEHCALCCLAVQPMGMPPAPAAVLPAPEGAAFVAARFLSASHTLFAWASAQARAPPRLS